MWYLFITAGVERNGELGMLASMLAVVAGTMVASWIGMLCGIKAPIEWPIEEV
jgi:hypothetical protein